MRNLLEKRAIFVGGVGIWVKTGGPFLPGSNCQDPSYAVEGQSCAGSEGIFGRFCTSPRTGFAAARESLGFAMQKAKKRVDLWIDVAWRDA